MYYVFKFSGMWSIYDKAKSSSRLLLSQEVELIQTSFSGALRGNAILDALMVKPVPANKLQDLTSEDLPSPTAIYYVCRFSGTWSLFDKTKGNSKLLQPREVEVIKILFSAALKETAILDAFLVTPISANKLQQLTKEEPAAPPLKKSAETVVRTNS